MVELLQAQITRATAATTAGIPRAYWVHWKGATDYDNILWAELRGNNVGDKDKAQVGQSLILLAGEKLQGYTQDSSNGGTCDFFLAYKITEFDA